MREKVKVLVAGGASFIGSKKVYFGVLNCIRCGEAYAGC
jgi:L-lactate utilization protein LutB